MLNYTEQLVTEVEQHNYIQAGDMGSSGIKYPYYSGRYSLTSLSEKPLSVTPLSKRVIF